MRFVIFEEEFFFNSYQYICAAGYASEEYAILEALYARVVGWDQ